MGALNFCNKGLYFAESAVTCRKQGTKASHALELFFNGKLPGFIKQE